MQGCSAVMGTAFEVYLSVSCDNVWPVEWQLLKLCSFRGRGLLGWILTYSGKKKNWESNQLWVRQGHPPVTTWLRSAVLISLRLRALSEYLLVHFCNKYSSMPLCQRPNSMLWIIELKEMLVVMAQDILLAFKLLSIASCTISYLDNSEKIMLTENFLLI